MVHSFFGAWSSHWINFQEPSYKVNESIIISSDSLLQRCLLCNKDVNFKLFVFVSWFFLSLRRMNSTLAFFVFIWSFHVNKTLSCEKVADQFTLLHHVLWN